MNDEDDFLCDDPLDTKYELKIEERDAERLKNEMKLTGYRDAYQKELENEACLQYGFDVAYKQFSRVGFLIGQIRSLVIYLDAIKYDSAFLSQVFTKLDLIESYSNYELLIEWSVEQVKADKLNAFLTNLEFKLNKFKDHLLNSSFMTDFKQVIINCLNDLSLDQIDPAVDTTPANLEEVSFAYEFENIKFKQ